MLQRISAKSSADSEVKSINRECSMSHARQRIVFSRKRNEIWYQTHEKALKHIEDLKILNFSRGRPPTPSPSERGEHRSSRNPPPHSLAGNITDLAGTTDDNVQTVTRRFDKRHQYYNQCFKFF